MFTIPCRGEALAVIGTSTSIPKRANASPLLFQKTTLLHVLSLVFVNFSMKVSAGNSLAGAVPSILPLYLRLNKRLFSCLFCAIFFIKKMHLLLGV